MAKQYFRLPTSSLLDNHVTDGRRFLVETKEKYDFIFADAYYSIYSIPFHLTTKEFFLLAKDRLSERGVFAMNVIGRLEGKGSQFLLSEIKTFSSVFKNSYFIAVESLDKKTVQNFIFIGLKDEAPKINFKDEKFLTSKKEIVSKLAPKIIDLRKLNLDSVFVLTDDFAPVEYLIADLLEV